MTTKTASRPVRVLVLDDHPSNLELAVRALARHGYVVTSATNAVEALQRDEAEGPFDLYVLDLMMPGIRGTEVARRVRDAHPGAKILYYTGYESMLFQDAHVLPENEAFVQKPVSTRDLAEAVSLLLFGHTRGPEPAG